MRRTGASFVIVVVLAGGVLAQQKRQQDIDLQAAIRTEMVDGDLNAAIKQYSAIVSKYKADRAVAATALVHMAECYQKLGDSEAKKIYERVVRDYADQKDALAVARARLDSLELPRRPTDVILRKVWADDAPAVAGVRGDTEGAISADGRFMTYVGEFNTKLFLRDLTTGSDRPLTSTPGPTYASRISKDGAAVAFNWCTLDQATCELRVASLQGAGIPQSRRLFGDDDVANVVPKDWSPDGKWIAVSLLRKDRSGQIGFVSVSDGTLRVLKSVDWRGPTKMFFSPGGRDIAYDLPVSENTSDRDVFVLAVDGSREVSVGSHPSNDRVMGWTPDGTHVLFASDRSGAIDLWAQTFAERKPQGPPELLKPDIGNVSSLGITRSGTLYMGLRENRSDIEIAPVDLTTGKQTATAARPIERFTGSNLDPVWSPDGKFLAYRSIRGEDVVLAIRSTETGDTRELRPRLAYFVGLSWAPDGRSFAVYGTDLKGRSGVMRIDARSGDVATIVFQSHVENLSYSGFSWSPDGKRMYYHGQRGSIYELDAASGTERVLVAGPPIVIGNGGNVTTPDGRLGPISVSPDGRWIASPRSEASGKSAVVALLPINGGSSRDLLRVNAPEWVNNTSMPWTPDGRAILVRKMTEPNGTTSELWLVPIDGTSPRKLDFDANHVATFATGRISVHPSGDRLAFVSGIKHTIEVWALENFLPAPTANK